MAKEATRPGFVFYLADIDVLEENLSAEEFFALIVAVKLYMRTGKIPSLTGAAKICFGFMKDKIDAQAEMYREKTEHAANMARARWEKEKQNETAEEQRTADSLHTVQENALREEAMQADAQACTGIIPDAQACISMTVDASASEKCKLIQTKTNQTKTNQTKPNRNKQEKTDEPKEEDLPPAGTETDTEAGRYAGAVNYGSPGPSPEQQAAFNEFRKAYPKKHGLYQTLPLFLDALQSVSAERMLEVLARQKRSYDWQKENGKYIPCADKWLREHCWEDEPETEEDPYALPSMY